MRAVYSFTNCGTHIDVRLPRAPHLYDLQTIRSMAAGIKRLGGRGDLRIELLTAGVKASARQKLLDDLRTGEVYI